MISSTQWLLRASIARPLSLVCPPSFLAIYIYMLTLPCDTFLSGAYPDIQAFKNFLPPWVYSRSANAFSFDPLPPEGGTSYDAEYFKNSEEVAAALSEVARRRGLREGEEEEEEEDDDDDDEVILPRVGVDHEAHEMLEALFADTDNAVIPPDQLDRVVQQLQLIIQLDHDQLLPLQRQALLERLDQLFDLGGQMPPPQPH
jgi:hypothetical protein